MHHLFVIKTSQSLVASFWKTNDRETEMSRFIFSCVAVVGVFLAGAGTTFAGHCGGGYEGGNYGGNYSGEYGGNYGGGYGGNFGGGYGNNYGGGWGNNYGNNYGGNYSGVYHSGYGGGYGYSQPLYHNSGNFSHHSSGHSRYR